MENTSKNTIALLQTDPRFINLQEKFKDLSPPKNLYIKNEYIIIDTDDQNWSKQTKYKWENPDIIDFVLEHLNKNYEMILEITTIDNSYF